METKLLQLYQHALEEYRFEVKLAWDRAKFYVVLNSALVTATAGLLKAEQACSLPLMGVLIVGLLSSLMGRATIRRGHDYYRRTIYKKTLIEDQLGLHAKLPVNACENATLAISTTLGQGTVQEILQNTGNWLNRRLRRWSITWNLIALMWTFLCLYLGLLGWCGWSVACAA